MVVKRDRESPSDGGGPPRLHNRIAVLRLERALSRQALADLVGVNHQTIGYLERGDYNPSLELAFRLSEVLYGRQRQTDALPPASASTPDETVEGDHP
jgi:DNA-binding XRE family transcriptional regulator